jgi:hypothetical protein
VLGRLEPGGWPDGRDSVFDRLFEAVRAAGPPGTAVSVLPARAVGGAA